MDTLRSLILKNRYTLLLTVLAVYVIVLVVEGAITGREAKVIDFDNPYFDFNARDMDQFMNNRREERE